ncbi:ARM repeat-containing protein [Lentinus tigrinus ALCF2SS1-7]|uniref:ARM repeat-containing protein n=1 Tax=Lentinus tigrinus ALCF2SS1-6 TaxID=1328759 RepID=A0A5C2S468_9APHY|nr:ARM repeat-containing protein [Lentinus tigrinus ALCF2SS1-6]RPD71937.1 ARM repeat-containing protein [Lentinus tigrinus ALCF2SS1-7]
MPTCGGSSFGRTPKSPAATLKPAPPCSRSLPANGPTPASPAKEDEPITCDDTIRALLNELLGQFDSVSDQIIACVNQLDRESSDGALRRVARIVHNRATAAQTSSAMYARLCKKMVEQISLDIRDETIRNAQGKPITGGQLFRKHLLILCEEDFERLWSTQGAGASATIAQITEEVPEAGVNSHLDDDRRSSVIAFMCELFKQGVLTERVMHNSIKLLLNKADSPEAIECLCTLFNSVGKILDSPRARAHMHVYFSRLQELVISSSVDGRTRAMVRNVIALRERGWNSRLDDYA